MTDRPTRQAAPLTYADAGVDVARGNAFVEAIRATVRSTARPGADSEIGGFGGVFDLKAAGFTDPLLVAANDGVGTKVKIAIETGIHHTVGIDLVAMCANDLVVQGAEPLFFLDYYATGRIDPEVGARIVAGIAEGCRQAGCALIGGETAEMPGLYAEADYDLAGFSVGAVERGGLLPRRDLEAGDAVLALASSGVHSNGFSLVRRIVGDIGLDWTAPAPFDRGRSLGAALLEPTRIYVRSALGLLREVKGVGALAHITGGGLTENLPRALPPHIAAEVDLSLVRPLPVFGWLARSGRVAPAEMLRTFNCGVGMAIVVRAEAAESALATLTRHGETAYRVGRLVPRGEGEAVRYTGALGLP